MAQYRTLTPEENATYIIAVTNLYSDLPFIWTYMSKVTPITVKNPEQDGHKFFIDPFGRICVPFFRTEDNDLVCPLTPMDVFHHIMHFLGKNFFKIEDEMVSADNLGYNPQTYVDGFCLAINDCLLSTVNALNPVKRSALVMPKNAFTPPKILLPRQLTAPEYTKRLLDIGSLSDPRDNEYDLRCIFATFSPDELAEIDEACPRGERQESENARSDLKLEILQFLDDNDANNSSSDNDSNSDSNNKNKNDSSNSDEDSEKKKEEKGKKKENGRKPGIERTADKIMIDFLNGKSSTTPWQDILAAKIAHTKISPWVNPQPDWAKSRRYNPSDCILPGASDRICDVLVGVDISGSMHNLLPYALLEVDKIIKEVQVSVKFFTVDTRVDNITLVNSVDELNLYGGGGTDMRKAYEYASTVDTDIFILLTDGETPYPNDNPCYCTVVTALLHPEGRKPDSECYPKFGEILEIPVE